jgi:uncharacterized protein (TIGR02145 family)
MGDWRKYIIGFFIFALISGGIYWFYNRSYRDPRVLGASILNLPGINKNIPDIYTDAVTVSFGDKTLGLQPVGGESVKVQRQDVRSIYEEAYKNTDVIQTDYPYKLKEELVFSGPGHPLIFKYNIKNFADFIIEKDQEGNVIFYDKQIYPKGKELAKVFTIPTPFVEDKVAQRSFSAVATTVTDGLLTISIDENWLMKATYPVTLDPTVEINILNLYSHPQTGDNWEVGFMTKGQADLRIIPENQATVDDDEFASLLCDGEERTPQILAGDVIYYPNWQCDGTGQVVHRTLKGGKHTLRFEFGDPAHPADLITAWAYNDYWYDTGWGYRKSHTVNAATGAGTNYQVKITAHYGSGSDSGGDVYLASHSRTDFADVRFTASDGSTLLDYWMESKTDSDNAVFWVEVAADLSSANQNIYIYYGNSGQSTSASNGSNTFLFFDDFSGDLSKWTIDAQNTDAITIVGGALRHNPDSTQTKNSYFDTRCYVTSLSLTNFSLNYKTYLGGGANRKIHQMGWRTDGLTFNSGYSWRNQNSASDGGFFRFASGSWSQIGTAYGPVSADTWYNMKVNAVGSNMETFINGTSVRTVTDATTSSGSLTSHVHGVGLGVNDYVLVDDVYVRKLVATEPAHSTWGSEEAYNAPPTLTVTQPDGTGDSVGSGALYPITYTLTDADSVATVSFYYDTNGTGLDGTAISGCANQAEGTDAVCYWDTTGLSGVSYYIYGITSASPTQVSDYSPSVVSIGTPTEFVSIVDPDSGTGYDYATLNAWEGNVQADLTDAATKVYAHSGKTGTVADSAAVTGATSGATATVAHASSTQILLKSISGRFQSGEQVRVDASNYVTLSDGGTSAIAVASCRSSSGTADTTAVTIDGWTTSALNYIKIWTDPATGARHQGKWDTNKYRIEANNNVIYSSEENVRIDGLQIYKNNDAYDTGAVQERDVPGAVDFRLSNSIIKGTGSTYANTWQYGVATYNNGGGTVRVWNNIFYDIKGSVDTNASALFHDSSTNYVYNNTFYNNYTAINAMSGTTIAKNNINAVATDGYVGSFNAASDYNISSVGSDTTGGAQDKPNTAVQFVDVAGKDFHLSPTDAAAKNAGVDLSNDANLPFSTDIDGQSRLTVTSWDIGADEESRTAVNLKTNVNLKPITRLHGGSVVWACGDALVDSRDSKSYATILIGSQCWMKQGLNVGTRVNGGTTQDGYSGTTCTTIKKYCYADTDANCDSNNNPNYPDGGLYQWDQAMCGSTTAGVQGICSSGWHIPTDAEQYILENYLKDNGQTCDASRGGGWDCSTAGTKLKPGGSSGFEINLSGYYDGGGSFANRTSSVYFWSSTQYDASNAWYRLLSSSNATVYRWIDNKASSGFTVRCLKN